MVLHNYILSRTHQTIRVVGWKRGSRGGAESSRPQRCSRARKGGLYTPVFRPLRHLRGLRRCYLSRSQHICPYHPAGPVIAVTAASVQEFNLEDWMNFYSVGSTAYLAMRKVEKSRASYPNFSVSFLKAFSRGKPSVKVGPCLLDHAFL